uniref:Uncharacterized protein n=1 Tax=Avena sativa TaxID=4498 RepID=A0ACD5T8E7_AVESA
MSSSDHELAAMEQDGVGRGEQAPAPSATLSGKKLWRMVRAVHLVLVRGLGKHQPKLAALGVNLHHMLSSSKRRHHHLGEAAGDHSPALTTYLAAALSCRSMDPAAAVHPYPRRGSQGGSGAGAGISSLSCRSMDPGAAVYQYRPREVEFSCKSTPLHRRRRRAHRHRDQGLLLPQQPLGDLPEYGSAVAVKTLFDLMDDDEDDDGDMESAIPWAASAPAPVGRPAARQVRITDSPFQPREDDEVGSMGVVDRRADEFIMWFHDQLRMQQQQQQRPAARDRTTHTGLGRW